MGKAKRRSFEEPFLKVPNETAKAPEIKTPTKSISLEALGLLVNINCYSDEWDLHKTELYKRFANNKRTSVNNAWKELTEAKYIFEFKYRDGKRWEHVYLYDIKPYSEEQIEILRQEALEEYEQIWDVDFAHPKMDTPFCAPQNQQIINTKGTKDKLTKDKLKKDNIKPIDDEGEPDEPNLYAFKEFVFQFEKNFPNQFDNNTYNSIWEQMNVQGLKRFTYKEAVNQARYMKQRIDEGKLNLGDYASYFVGGILRKRSSEKSAILQEKIEKAEKEYKAKKELEEQQKKTKPIEFYNWLDQ